MKRAVVVYLDNNQDQMKLFRCLYTSYKFINSIDTDLVVFGHPFALTMIPNDCIKINLPPEEEFPFNEYRFINSLSCLTKKEANFLDGYDFILRTDVDTLLTPAWNQYYPEGYKTGKGVYANHFSVKQKILEVAERLQLNHQGIFNIGSTHYGKSSLVKEVCNTATKVTSYLLNSEFKNYIGQWPQWYRGVSSMYAAEIATNHHVQSIQIDPKNLDVESTLGNPITDQPHIHFWHTHKIFSKFVFLNGGYNQFHYSSIQTDRINTYCLSIALLSSKEFNINENQT